MLPKYKKMLTTGFVYLTFGLLSLFILINLFLGINKAITHNPVPKVFGISPLIVMSGSMEPAIYPGDVVIIWEQAAEKYKIGDIVTYLVGQTPFTHRIVGEENGLFILKGDSNNTVDDTVSADRFEGKVLFTVPKIGVAIVFFKKPAGMAVLVMLLLLYINGGDLYKKVRGTVSK
ncbi:signal peptidase I [Candidatus Formimonas warabiya]|uniref:Signal peptidase I n=1 Tax=Formimonas warabiya TaxID=1761012 RepID=A0A3G1KLY1_FORW1|nr:signal peptidase I [Candidatus Formimonas warabiya]ATW23433.1 signal peptidase I [Candidatus Formimonas warabiya]